MLSKKYRKNRSENKLYFIIRSWLMGQIGGIILYIAILIFGSINFVQAIIIGIFGFIISLMISSYFEKYINKMTKKIMKFLNKHKRIENFIIKRF
jgi:hypothetical protein